MARWYDRVEPRGWPIGRTTDDDPLPHARTLREMKRAGSVLCPVIVGRDDLLERIDLLLGEVAKGRGSTLFLAGSAGLGKTRLLRAAIAKATAAGIRLDGGMVAPQDHLVPLASIRDFAVGIRRDEAWGSLGDDLLAIDGAH